MGIEASYRRLPERDFQQMLDDSALADAYFGFDIDEADEERIDIFFVGLQVRDLQTKNRYLTIDKFWDALHCLLTGFSTREEKPVASSLDNVVQGGKPTPWEATYGMVRYLTPQEVKDTAFVLQQLDEIELQERYKPSAFQAANLYPSNVVWGERGSEYLLEIFRQVRDFFVQAAQDSEVMLLSFD